jgi:predicted O-methyltransferase YrrM
MTRDIVQPLSGHPAVDRYLQDGFAEVRGMSSRFSAGICGHLMRRQTELGIRGHAVEIGTFEGRFFLALALGLEPPEHAFGFDTFDWPNEGVLDRLHGHVRAHGLSGERYSALKRRSLDLAPQELRALMGPMPARFIHIDGDHSPESLAHDLALADAVLHPSGLICLDDMLHPGYPFLVSAVQAYLEARPGMRLMAVIDREDIVAAAKFLLCRDEAVASYEDDLMASFARFHYVLGGDALGHHCVVLTPEPRLAEVD